VVLVKGTKGRRDGELILNEERLTITFRFMPKTKSYEWTAWDCNERSLDGFNPLDGLELTYRSYFTYTEYMN